MHSWKLSNSEFWLRLKADVMADKRKTVIMGVLAIAASWTGLKLALADDVPDRAQAQAAQAMWEQESQGLVVEETSDERATRELEEYLADVPETITRDLFLIDYESYPPTKTADETVSGLGKSGSKRADEAAAELARKKHEAEVRKKAEPFTLQSTMPGERASVIIGIRDRNKMSVQVVSLGDEIDGFGFIVQRIDADSCTIVLDGVPVLLSLETNKKMK